MIGFEINFAEETYVMPDRPVKLLALALALLPTPVLALDQCEPSQMDQTIRLCTFAQAQRYRIAEKIGFPVNLQFSPDERIKRIEFGYTGKDKDGNPSPTWQGPNEKAGTATACANAGRFVNNLPIWPFQAGQSGLLVVTCRPDGAERLYNFDLLATDDFPTDATSGLLFQYPDDAKAAAKAQAEAAKAEASARRTAALATWHAKQEKQAETEGIARLKTDVFYGPVNKAYRAHAEAKYASLAPKSVSDNGQLTQMQWPGNVPVPTVAIWHPETKEEIAVTPSTQGHMIVISGTAHWWRLRLGKDAVMDIENLHWSAEKPDPETGTSSPDVIRTVIYRSDKPK
jgi:type IV secretory pathway VirB9-like protein